MAYGIRELAAIDADGTNLLNDAVLFEGVTDPGVADSSRRYARKVTAGQLDAHFARQGSLVEAMAREKTDGEESRARAAEAELAAELARLDYAKAGKITGKKSLAVVVNGDVPGVIAFDTAKTPAAPAATGRIDLDNGGYFLATDGQGWVFSYNDGSATTEIYRNGQWLADRIDTGGAAVTGQTGANGSVWVLSRWGPMDLQDVRDRAEEDSRAARAAAASALEAAVNAGNASAAESARAQAAESALRQAADGEESRAAAAEAQLLQKLSDEESRAQGQEALIAQAAADETARAAAEEARLLALITAETARAAQEEGAETARAAQAESALQQAVTDETARAAAEEALLKITGLSFDAPTNTLTVLTGYGAFDVVLA